MFSGILFGLRAGYVLADIQSYCYRVIIYWWMSFRVVLKNQSLLLFVWKIIICLFGLGNFFLLNCADLTDKIDIGLDIVDFINYNKNSWSKTSNALPIIFCCKMCLFWVCFFHFTKKLQHHISGVFLLHFTLYKSEKYMFCTLLICYQFLWLEEL